MTKTIVALLFAIASPAVPTSLGSIAFIAALAYHLSEAWPDCRGFARRCLQ